MHTTLRQPIDPRGGDLKRGPSITAIVDRRLEASQVANTILWRLSHYCDVSGLVVVMQRSRSPIGAYGAGSDLCAAADLSPDAWVAMQEWAIRRDHERVASISRPLIEAGHSPRYEFASGTVRQALREVASLWPSDVLLAASPSRWLPTHAGRTPIERLPVDRRGPTVVSALSWY